MEEMGTSAPLKTGDFRLGACCLYPTPPRIFTSHASIPSTSALGIYIYLLYIA